MMYTASANTCQNAKNKISNMATDLGAACSGPNDIPCQPVLVVDVKCHDIAGGKKEVTAHYVYGCATCIDVEEPCPGCGTN
jgi:hypothetical protein